MMDADEAMRLIRTEEPGQVAEGLAWLRKDAESRPDDAEAWFRYGGGLDRSGDEAGAMAVYRRVQEMGLERLPVGDQPCFYLQAGSTLRNLDLLDEARELLAAGVERFPDFRALTVFLALAEVSAGQDRRAIDLLLATILTEGSGDESIQTYARALAWYVEDRRQS